MTRLIRCVAVLAVITAGACAPATQNGKCLRHEGVALTPENGFAAAVDFPPSVTIDAPPERINVAMMVVRPVRGTIDLVHVIGDRESERWTLVVAAEDHPLASCWISTSPGSSTCRATVQDLPHPVGGYYYLRANGNTVLEAGVSFYLCQ